MGKKWKKVYRVKHWDNRDPVKFGEVSTQKPLFPGIDILGKLYFGELFFDDIICKLFTVYDMEGRRYLVFHLKGTKRYLLCRFRMRILNKLKKNVFTVQDVFTRFTKERFMIENFDPDNYNDDEIVNELTSYREWLLYDFPEFNIIRRMFVPEQEINKENVINKTVEERRTYKNYKNINIGDLYFEDIMYLGNLYVQNFFIDYGEPIVFSLIDDKQQLYLCVLTDNNSDIDNLYNLNNHYYKYILVKTNQTDINNLLREKQTIYDYIKNCKDIYLLTNQGTGIVVQKQYFADIDSERLPDSNMYLNY